MTRNRDSTQDPVMKPNFKLTVGTALLASALCTLPISSQSMFATSGTPGTPSTPGTPGTPGMSGVPGISVSGLAKPVPTDPKQKTAPFDTLDNVEGDRVIIMNPPVNPMVVDDVTLTIWAIDNHNNEVHVFDDTTGVPSATWGVPAGPVSLALWEDQGVDGGNRLLVVCRASWVVCMLDRTNGRILGVLQMEDPVTGASLGEPSDILVDAATDQAYVTCSASDAVVEIDLDGWSITDVFRLPSKNPVFLSFDANGDVLVVPQLSGNNTVVHRGEVPTVPVFNDAAQELGIMNLDDPALAVSGLNDYDVFRVVRSGPLAGTVQPAAKSVGTVLFAHEINTITGDLWVLNTEANNKNPLQQDEPSLNGDFAFNRLSLVSLSPGQVVKPHKIIDLDVFGTDLMGDPIYDKTRSVAQPFNLHCTSNGFTFVVGMLSNNVTLYSPTGDFVLEWDLPRGAIPRAVEYSEILNTVFVYCWGINRVLGYVVTNPIQPFWFEGNLGADPLPDDLKKGREILFSAEFSENNRFSCLTCHIEGQADLVAWPIAGAKDDKGPMMTQVLTGLETVHPFHWRGERVGEGAQLMLDFNGAFTGLLGSARELETVEGGEWDNFEDFVFALQQPANPREHRDRVVFGAHEPPQFSGAPAANSVQGLNDFRNACTNCHSFPKGTSNDETADGAVVGELNTHRMDFKVAPFQAIWRRQQDADPNLPGIQVETVDFVNSIPNLPDTDIYPPLGVGFTHAGLFTNLQLFIALGFGFPFQTTADLTGFIDQWDSGLAPLTYRAWHVDGDTGPEVFADITDYLVPQCTTPNLTGTGQSVLNGDFAVIGTFEWQGAEIPMRWFWDPTQQLLIPEDSTVPPQLVATLLAQAANGESANTFIGLPLGTARQFAVDKDGDDLFNVDELNQPGGGSDPEEVDSDGDGFWDGHEVMNGSIPTDDLSIPVDSTRPTFVNNKVEILWVTATTAVVLFETSEQTTALIRYKSNTGDVGKARSPHFARRHRIVLAGLDPSSGPGNPTDYVGVVTITDHAGLNNQPRKLLPSLTMLNFNGQPDRVRADSMTFKIPPTSPTSVMTVEVRAVQRTISGTPIGLFGYQVIANVCLDGGDPVALDTQGGPQAFSVLGSAYDKIPGPFVLSSAVTDSNGFAELAFSVPSAQVGQKLTVVLHGIQRPGANWTAATPDFDTIFDWSFSDTPKEARSISIDL